MQINDPRQLYGPVATVWTLPEKYLAKCPGEEADRANLHFFVWMGRLTSSSERNSISCICHGCSNGATISDKWRDPSRISRSIQCWDSALLYDVGQTGEDWNDSAQSKEQVDANLQHRQEAAIRRERALAYAYSHQMLTG
ncbi:hypothetical protein ACET3Z_011289 [Daucus carota]